MAAPRTPGRRRSSPTVSVSSSVGLCRSTIGSRSRSVRSKSLSSSATPTIGAKPAGGSQADRFHEALVIGRTPSRPICRSRVSALQFRLAAIDHRSQGAPERPLLGFLAVWRRRIVVARRGQAACHRQPRPARAAREPGQRGARRTTAAVRAPRRTARVPQRTAPPASCSSPANMCKTAGLHCRLRPAVCSSLARARSCSLCLQYPTVWKNTQAPPMAGRRRRTAAARLQPGSAGIRARLAWRWALSTSPAVGPVSGWR